MTPEPQISVKIFYSYAHEDEKLRDELVKHLANLRRQGVITEWYDRDISAGTEWEGEIKQHLDSARVILLLISPDFMNSDYSNDVEVTRAIERHDAGDARVIPIILRPVDWEGAPFSKLQALPTDAEPVTSWVDQDEAFLDITKGIRTAIQQLAGPSASVPTVPDIPRPPNVGFVSRRDKDGSDIVERLREELAPQRNQLVALWGAGGVGKTTLAAEAARALSEVSGQRIIWITAEGRPKFAFSTLLDDIAEQLGRTDLRPLAVGPKEEALRPLIGVKQTLIVLDNLETITPIEESICKDFLAKRAPCPALITTRERIDDAFLIPLAPMSPDEAGDFLSKLIAQTQDPDIYAKVDHGRILRTAEFNPLIIRWIVAQIDLAQDPEEVLKDLAHGVGDAAERVFDRSFNLPQMAEGGRPVLLALSLFMPSASRPALAEVAGMKEPRHKKRFKHAQQTLASLWLIKQTDGGRRLAVDGLTRDLASAKLFQDSRVSAFRDRYQTRFSKYSSAHSKTTSDNLDALEAEKDNLLHAFDLAFESRNWTRVIGMYVVLDDLLELRGYWDEAIKRGKQATLAAQEAHNFSRAMAVTVSVNIIRTKRGEFDEAGNAYLEALHYFERMNDEEGIAVVLCNLATLKRLTGNLVEANELCTKSLEIGRRRQDSHVIVAALNQLGLLAVADNRLSEAEAFCEEGLHIANLNGNQIAKGHITSLLGEIARRNGDFDGSRQKYHQAMEILKKLGDQSAIGEVLFDLGLMCEEEGIYAEASRFFGEALMIAERLQSRDISMIRGKLESLKR